MRGAWDSGDERSEMRGARRAACERSEMRGRGAPDHAQHRLGLCCRSGGQGLLTTRHRHNLPESLGLMRCDGWKGRVVGVSGRRLLREVVLALEVVLQDVVLGLVHELAPQPEEEVAPPQTAEERGWRLLSQYLRSHGREMGRSSREASCKGTEGGAALERGWTAQARAPPAAPRPRSPRPRASPPRAAAHPP